jgi:OmpA-OmpF porin, OOP family
MRLSIVFINAAALLLAAGLSLVAAGFSVTAIEIRTETGVRMALDNAAYDWAEVQADGLKVILSGTAPDEAARFNALSTAGGVVDAARIIDSMRVTPSAGIVAPQFSVEILRNDSGISIIGLIPDNTGRAALIARLNQIDGTGHVSDLLQEAHYPVPRGWDDAMGFAVIALEGLARSKISASAGQVSITAIADSVEAKRALEKRLKSAAPPGLRLTLNIAAPRPVITPFTLRYLIDDTGGRFDACSADTAAARASILSAAGKAGLTAEARCVIGMGSPSPSWARAAGQAMTALADIGAGSVTMSDTDITLVAAQGTSPALFDRVMGELETALPRVFALRAVLPEPADADDEAGPPEFTATLSPEGMVQLRGRLSDDHLRNMADAYARARFGSGAVYTATRLVDGLPPDWSVRVLAGLESLSMLVNGAVTVTPDTLSLKGISEREEASAEIAGLLADKLGGAGTFSLDITYREPRAPVDIAPQPDTCEADLTAVQAASKIAFEPGSATISAEAMESMDAIAAILTLCGDIRLEIQGHTDSQGRESMNQQLSQERAESVLNELRARRVPTSTYTAVGYGETQPIADNDTEAGREKNRRIVFSLFRPELVQEAESTLDGAAIEQSEPTPAKQEGETAGAADAEPDVEPDAKPAPAPAADAEEPHDPVHPEPDDANAQSGG